MKREGNRFTFGNRMIEFLTPTIVRVWEPTRRVSRAIEGEKAVQAEVSVEQREGCAILRSQALEVRVSEDFKVDFYDRDGRLICQDYRGERNPFLRHNNNDEKLMEAEGHVAQETVTSNKIQVLKTILGDEKFYGFGETTGHLNKKGYEYEMWNTDDPRPHVENYRSLYKSIPFFAVLRDEASYGIFFDNTFKTFFNMGKENADYFCFGADDGELNYYFIYGDGLKDVLKGYTYLTGRTPLPQRWTLGFQQCRWSYPSEKRIKEIAAGFRDNDVPCDVLYLDIDYMDGYRVFTWDRKVFPDPEGLMKELKDAGFKVVTIIDPGVKKDKGYGIYDEGLENGYFATDADGVPYVNAVWPGDSLYPDFSDEPVRRWWAGNQKYLTEVGVSGVWNDMNEPASFKGPLPDDVQFKNDGAPADHSEIHNVYGALMSKATNEVLKDLTGKRPFVITRACYAGIQKYSTVWTGDNHSFWEHLRMAVPMLMNLGMSGVAFCGTDVGGFSFDCTPELLSRWVQVGCFTPLFRNHSGSGTRDQEPWAFDKETLDINRKYIKLRYRLLPYLYDALKECEESGLPVMRPLVLHYEKDPNTHELNDQFLFGEKILVAPVVQQGQRFRGVYLPEGEWFDYWTGQRHAGGQAIIKETPLDVCPIYVKAGSVIPCYPEMSYVGETPVEQLILEVYPGEGTATHYQDDGESYEYRDGAYNLYSFRVDNAGVDVAISHQGFGAGYAGFKVILNGGAKAASFNGKGLTVSRENGKAVVEIPAVAGRLTYGE